MIRPIQRGETPALVEMARGTEAFKPIEIQALQEVLENSSQEELSDGHKLIEVVQKKAGQKGKKLYMPIRIALTGKTTGPEMVSILSIVGRDRCLQRVRQVLSQTLPLKKS